ncbi:MFS transporter, partial [Candidatus Hakubella thermalkaliphila]
MDHRRYHRSKRNIANIFLIGSMMMGVSGVVLGPLIPIITQELNINLKLMSLIFVGGSISFSASVLISGYLADRLGKRLISLFGLVSTVLGLLGFSVIGSFPLLFLFNFLLAFGNGALAIGSQTILSDIYPEKRSSMIIRLNLFFGLGAFVGPLALSFILFQQINWRFAFLAFAFLFFFLLLLFMREKVTAPSPKQRPSNKETLLSVFNPTIVLCGLILLFYMGAQVPFSTWFTTYLSAFGVPVSISSLAVSGFWLSIAVGTIIFARMARRYQDLTLVLWGSVATLVFVLIIALWDNVVAKMIFTALFGLSLSGIFPLSMSLAIHQKPQASGAISGLLFAMTSLGALYSQPLVGFVSEILGRERGIYVGLGNSILLLGTVLVLVLVSRRKSL